MQLHQRLLAQLLLLLFLYQVSCRVAELSSSIIMMGQPDYTMQGNRSRCTDMVDSAANLPNSKLNFVPTLFWVNPKTANSETSSDAFFCVKRTLQPNGTTSCPPVSQQDIYEFANSMHKCFARAVSYNLSIAITPHIADGTDNNMWRNTLLFDPLMPSQQHSYMDVMLQPLADAVKGGLGNETKLWFSIQGGMGASLFQHPKSYHTILQALQVLKKSMLTSMPGASQSNIKFGISSNFNKLCGCTLLSVSEPEEYLTQFPAAFAAIKHTFDMPSIQAVFQSVNFVGVSTLIGQKPGFSAADLQHAVDFFDKELSYFGVNVSQLLQESDLELHWSEVGVGGGGGLGPKKVAPARDATQAAKFPFVGILGPYKQSTDPWMLYNINTKNSPVRDYASFFYQQAVEYLWKQHEYKYPVDAAFLNNIGSWDVQAVHPESVSSEGSYAYLAVVNIIKDHNERVQRLVHLTESLGVKCVRFLLDSKQSDFIQRLTDTSKEQHDQDQTNIVTWR